MERKQLNEKADFDRFIEQITASGRYVSSRAEKSPDMYPCIIEWKVYKVRNFVTKLIDETVVYNFKYEQGVIGIGKNSGMFLQVSKFLLYLHTKMLWSRQQVEDLMACTSRLLLDPTTESKAIFQYGRNLERHSGV